MSEMERWTELKAVCEDMIAHPSPATVTIPMTLLPMIPEEVLSLLNANDQKDATIKAAGELADFAWTFKAYPQGLAGQDHLLGVSSEDVLQLRNLAARIRAVSLVTEGEK